MGTVATRLTAEQFLALREDPLVKRELIDGEVLEMPFAGSLHERVKANFLRALAGYLDGTGHPGVVTSETPFRFGDDVLKPDVALVLSGNLDPSNTGTVTAIPDLVVSVAYTEPFREVVRKTRICLDRGVKTVIVASPEDRTIQFHKASGHRWLRCGETLQDPDLLPGFSVPVDNLFHGL